jgi:hypothetical protein
LKEYLHSHSFYNVNYFYNYNKCWLFGNPMFPFIDFVSYFIMIKLYCFFKNLKHILKCKYFWLSIHNFCPHLISCYCYTISWRVLYPVLGDDPMLYGSIEKNKRIENRTALYEVGRHLLPCPRVVHSARPACPVSPPS